MKSRTILAFFSALAVATVSGRAEASPIFTVSFADPSGAMAPFYSVLESHTIAAGDAWGVHLAGAATLEVELAFPTNIPGAAGASATSSFVTNVGGVDIFEQGGEGRHQQASAGGGELRLRGGHGIDRSLEVTCRQRVAFDQ